METDPTQTLPAPPTCPRPGMGLGSYVLDRPLGKGGMASVWLGHHHLIGAPLAIKILDPRTASEPGLVARFLREARLAGNIRHPTLVPVHDVGCDAASGLNYMVMDYLPGGSAADLLRRHHGTLPETDAVRIVLRVAEALCQAERHDLVHRDIKPDNILFDERGEARLADLGIAKARQAIGPEVTATLTLTSEIRGTPSYMAPEQVCDFAHVDIRADIYSLGVVFYEMLTGKRPYPGKNTATILRGLLSPDPPPDLRALCPAASDDTVGLIRAMMDKDAERRPRTAAILVDSLRGLHAANSPTTFSLPEEIARIIAERRAAEPPLLPLPDATQAATLRRTTLAEEPIVGQGETLRLPTAPRRRLWALVGAAAAALLLLLGVVLWVFLSRPAPAPVAAPAPAVAQAAAPQTPPKAQPAPPPRPARFVGSGLSAPASDDDLF